MALIGGRRIMPGENDAYNEWLNRQRRQLGLPDFAIPGPTNETPAPEPAQRQGGGFLGGGSWGDRLNNLAGGLGQAGAYFDGDWGAAADIGTARGKAAQAARDAATAKQQQAQLVAALRDKYHMTDAEAAIALQDTKSIGENFNKRFAPPPEPTPPPEQKLQEWYTTLSPEQRQTYDQLHPVINNDWQGPHVIPRSSIGQNGGGLPTVSDQQSYDALPPGATYLDPEGHTRTKGGGVSNGTGSFQLYPYGRR